MFNGYDVIYLEFICWILEYKELNHYTQEPHYQGIQQISYKHYNSSNLDPSELYPTPVLMCLYQGVPKAATPMHIPRMGG